MKAELLAPAGDKESFYTAINNGADAVYIGLQEFNARLKADNFDAPSLRENIEYAHFYGVKVYVAVNTLVCDREMVSLINTVKIAVEAKADAYIVQDLGVAAVLKKCFPDIVLHASTQAAVSTPEAAAKLYEMGFKRVVLARETKLEDIKRIKSDCPIEVEFFVHGALCVSFSGNCYLSESEFGASGNRGQCKQLCRLPYQAFEKENNKLLIQNPEKLKTENLKKIGDGYLLSARDLCLMGSLQELCDAGVTSFKIEGRMRRSGYVGEVVRLYRAAMDGESDLNSNEKKLKIAFSRGEFLKRAYLNDGTPDGIINSVNQNHTGVRIGEVCDVKPFGDLYEIKIFSGCELFDGDGIKLFDGVVEKASLGLGGVKRCGEKLYSVVTKYFVKKGWSVNLITSAPADKAVEDAKLAINIKFRVKAVSGLPIVIKATAANAGSVSAEEYGDVCQKAIKLPLTADEITAQIIKTGDTGFNPVECEVETDGVFIPKSALNLLRRKVLNCLKNKIVAENEKNTNAFADNDVIEKIIMQISKNNVNNTDNIVLTSDCVNSNVKLRFVDIDAGGAVIARQQDGCVKSMTVKAADKNEIEEISVLRPKKYNAYSLETFINAYKNNSCNFALELPNLVNGKDIEVLDAILEKLKGKVSYLLVENLYGLKYSTWGYKLIAGPMMNVENSFTAEVLKNEGVELFVVKSKPGAGDGNFFKEIPLMTLAHCPYKTIYGCTCEKCAYRGDLILTRDGKKYILTRVCISDCYFKLYAL